MVHVCVLVIISPLSGNLTLTELRIYLGISHGFTFNLIHTFMEFCYGQISIETVTYSQALQSLLKRCVEDTSLDAIRNVPELVKIYHAITIEHWPFKFSRL